MKTRILKIIDFDTNIDPFFGTMLNLCATKSYIFTSHTDYFKFIFFTLQKLAITDDVVKMYRNYVILYSLNDAIAEVSTCVTGI